MNKYLLVILFISITSTIGYSQTSTSENYISNSSNFLIKQDGEIINFRGNISKPTINIYSKDHYKSLEINISDVKCIYTLYDNVMRYVKSVYNSNTSSIDYDFFKVAKEGEIKVYSRVNQILDALMLMNTRFDHYFIEKKRFGLLRISSIFSKRSFH